MPNFALTPADLKGLSKSQQFEKVAQAAGVPVETLKGIWQAESSSGTNPKAFVPNPFSSAIGDFQVTDPALQDVESRTGQKLNRQDFTDSLFAAGSIMHNNMQAFDGDVGLATAAYNQGIGKARSQAGAEYAAKVSGEPLETYTQDPNNNKAMAAVLYAPQLTSSGDVVPRDLAQSGRAAPKEVDSKTSKAAQLLSQGDVANAGGSVQQVMNAGQAGQQLGPEQQAVEVASVPGPQASAGLDALDFQSNGSYEQAADQQQLVENTSAWQAAVDSGLQNNIVARMAHSFRDDYIQNQTRDPNWKYTAEMDLEDRKTGYTEVEMDQLRNAVSDLDYAYRKQEIQDDRDSQFNLAQHGIAGFAGGIVGGALDPVQWLIGGGVGAGVSSAVRATSLAARIAVGSASASLSNIAITGALDAAGANVTSHDYVMAGLTGAMLGVAGGMFHAGTAASLEALRSGMAQAKANLHIRAAAELGEGATPDQIQARATQLDQQDFEARENLRNSINLARVDESQKITSADRMAVDQPSGPVLPDGSQRTVLNDVLDKHPILNTISDEAEQKILAEQIYRAEQSNALRPVDKAKIESNFVRVMKNTPKFAQEWLETQGMTLARSDNPIAQWVSGNLMESALGTSERVRTASVTKTQLENISREQWGEYNSIRELYRHETGGNPLTEMFRGSSRNEFDAAVAREVSRRRFNGPETDESAGVHQRVKEGADAIERIYQQQLGWQKAAQTLGWEHLPESARGYMPQRVNIRRLLAASNVEKDAFVRAIATQLVGKNGVGEEAALTLAKEYFQHAVRRGSGAVERPDHLISDDISDNIMEAMDRLGLNGEAAAKRLGNRYQRGGASYTKKRYDLDMDAPVQHSDGSTARLGDYFVTDQDSLFQRYMARNTGEVALAKYGIQGQPGITALRDAMAQVGLGSGNANAARELETFDAFMADMMGQPLSGQGATAGAKAMQAFRQLTSMNLLGGMGFTQAAELANVATHLGLDAMMKSIPIVRQMFRDVRLMKGNKLYDQIEVIGGRNGASEKWHFPYEQSPDDLRLYGYDTPGLTQRALSTASRAFQVINGHRMVHEWQMRMATEQLASKVLRAANGTTKFSKLVEDMGFSPKFMEGLKADLPNIAEFDGTWVKNLDLSRTKDPVLMNEFIQGVQRGAKQIIQGSFRGEGMKAQTHWLGQILTQFRSFSFLAMEKQWGRVAGRVGVPMATAYMIGQMMLAIPVHLARVQLNSVNRKDPEQYIKDNTNPVALTMATMNYAGLTGLMGDFLGAGFNAYATATGNDLRRETPVGRGGTQQWSVGGLVPAISYGDTALRNAYGLVAQPSFTNAAKFGKSVLPGGNIPYFAFAMNHLTQ